MRPTTLNTKLQTKTVPMPESFPTPMEEPRKVMRARFLGAVQVDKPCGIDVIHGAIDQVSKDFPEINIFLEIVTFFNMTTTSVPSTDLFCIGYKDSIGLSVCKVYISATIYARFREIPPNLEKFNSRLEGELYLKSFAQ
jgi:hypothetical protein